MATDPHEPPAPLGASIRIFLANGVADGVWVVEKSNWTGTAAGVDIAEVLGRFGATDVGTSRRDRRRGQAEEASCARWVIRPQNTFLSSRAS